jgi:DNA repair exonuclease SbcCD nuclease subunit
VLCIHQTVEGAQVGASNYTFRGGPDVVCGSQLPGGFAAVLSGHIHRSQVLTQDLAGRPLASPVIYPGAVERTSYAERLEPKHYAVLRLRPGDQGAGTLTDLGFVPLPARPMLEVQIGLDSHTPESLVHYLRQALAQLDPDAVVRVRLEGQTDWDARAFVTAARLRSLAPATMNVSLAPDQSRWADAPRVSRQRSVPHGRRCG